MSARIPPVGTIVFFEGRGLIASVISWTTLPLGVYVFSTVMLLLGAALAWQSGFRLTYFSCSVGSILGLATVFVLGNVSKPSHVAIVSNIPTANSDIQPVLVESTTLAPMTCLVSGKFAKGVQAHEYADRIRSYDGRVWLYVPHKPLTASESAELMAMAFAEMGKKYTELGAMVSATRLVRWAKHTVFRHSSAKRWCSKFVVLMLKHINRYPMGFHSDRSPAAVERDLLRTEAWDYVKVR